MLIEGRSVGLRLLFDTAVDEAILTAISSPGNACVFTGGWCSILRWSLMFVLMLWANPGTNHTFLTKTLSFMSKPWAASCSRRMLWEICQKIYWSLSGQHPWLFPSGRRLWKIRNRAALSLIPNGVQLYRAGDWHWRRRSVECWCVLTNYRRVKGHTGVMHGREKV